MVWEYYLKGRYVDGMLFYSVEGCESEVSGLSATELFPLRGQEVILCEAKKDLNPEVIGQAIVYTRLALRAGANLRETVVLTERGSEPMQEVAMELGLTVVVRPLDCQGATFSGSEDGQK